MGYWNGWSNWAEWYFMCVDWPKQCLHCGGDFWPNSPRQKYCSRDDSPSCDDDRHFERLWQKGRHPLQLANNFLE